MILIHHLWYNYFQIATIPLANGILLYKMWTQRNTDWTQYEVREKFGSYWEGLNLFDMNPYKIRHPELNPEKLVPASQLANYKKTDGDTKKGEELIAVSAVSGKPYLQEDWIDKVYRVFLAFCIFYYMVDTIIKLYEMEYPRDLFDGCKMGFFVHHVITIMGFKSIFVVDHYTWFLTGPMAYHTVVVGYP